MSSPRLDFARKLGAFSSATMLSRILGYIRDALVAATFGGGLLTDAFYAAFRVPNLLRRFLGEGSMTAAFVPVFTEVLHKDGKEEADKLLRSLLSGLLIVLGLLVAAGILFAPGVTKLVAWGFTENPEKFSLTVELVRLIFPFLFVISLAALLTAVLNSCGKFFTPAVAPSGLSIAEIAFILFIASRMDSPIHGLAVAAVAGGLLHFLWQVPGVRKEGFHLRPGIPFSHPRTKEFFLLLGPTIIGLGSDQINAFVDQFCASFLRDGSITALYNSNRIMQLPLALFGIAVSSVALPALSKSAAAQRPEEFKDLLGFSIRIANFVLIPSVAGLAALGLPIIQLLFEHGKFLPEYSLLTYAALVPYAIGLPAYSAVKIFATGFYAHKDTRTPVKVALWAMVFHVIMNFVLMWKLRVAGLALSTALSAWLQAIVLFILLRRRFGPIGGRQVMRSFVYSAAAGLAMAGLCWALSEVVLAELRLFVRVPLVIMAGAGFYFGLAALMKIPEFGDLKATLTRRKIPQNS